MMSTNNSTTSKQHTTSLEPTLQKHPLSIKQPPQKKPPYVLSDHLPHTILQSIHTFEHIVHPQSRISHTHELMPKREHHARAIPILRVKGTALTEITYLRDTPTPRRTDFPHPNKQSDPSRTAPSILASRALLLSVGTALRRCLH